MEYKEDEFLPLSGLQHFVFCRRQWALIHIENRWAENYLTISGELMHERVHDAFDHETRGDLMTVRGMYIHSASLGVSGQCDVVEFRRDPDGITLSGKEGRWQPFPVEYKRGRPKDHDGDRLQLCGQALCLEEMLCCDIPRGAIFYGESRRRETVEFTEELRNTVRSSLAEMHALFKRGYTPKVRPSKSCAACSIKDSCLPTLLKRQSVDEYLRKRMEECR